MNYRNEKYNEDGTLDCEIDHPEFGWIPTTLSGSDAETTELFAQIVAAGNVAPYVAPVISADDQAVIDVSLVKINGKEYATTGVTVPFTSVDALAVLQVKAAFEVGVIETVIAFSNGQKLSMVSADFTAFATWFANERNQFFLT